MNADDLLTEERRARMAAERLLAQKEAELFEANRMLSRHARALSEDLVETRGVVAEVRGENTRVRADLERATTEVDIAKRRLWNSIQTIEDGFAVFDAESRLVIANTAYLLPFDGLECIRPGAHYQEVIEAALSEGVVDTGGMSPAQWREEMLARWFSPAPEPRVIRLWDGTWVRLVDNRAPGGDTVSLGLNITEAMRREAALNDARNRAEAANRAKSAFLANMSHEIRTPMNGVVAMADLMAESDLDEENRLYVETIRSSGQALLTIINDVLDYSKIEAEKLVLRPEPIDLERMIFDVVQLLMPSIREKGLNIGVDYDMFLPTRFEADPLRLRQVLTNLVGNAVKFTAQGHVLIRVAGLPEEDGRAQRLHITVEDTGIGIPADMLEHVFGEFNQVEDERNRAFEGTGLGLAISRELVRLMGGRVWAESEVGVGSVFGVTLSLPVIAESLPPALPEGLTRALLVMAEDENRLILERRLIALGLEVVAVATAAEAGVHAARAQVIFADQRLADMSVAAFIAVLRGSGVVAPVLLLVAPGQVPPAQIAGAATVLHKPLARPELLAALAAIEVIATAEPEPENMPEPAPMPEPDAPAPVFGSRRGDSVPVSTAPVDPLPEPLAEAPVFGSARARSTPAPEAEGQSPAPALDNLFADVLEPLPPAMPLPPSAAPAAEAPRPMRVLVAEDNKTNQFVLAKLLKDCDIELTFAANGNEAVAAYGVQRPDIVFMDISMPGMDGKEATRHIRALEAETGLPRTRIVALTAHAMAGDADEILAHGLDEHLSKPVKKPEILAEIAAARPEEARPPLPAPPLSVA